MTAGPFIAAALLFLGGLACVTVLALNGHPWIAIAMLTLLATARLRWRSSS